MTLPTGAVLAGPPPLPMVMRGGANTLPVTPVGVGILGASGYAGQELLQLLSRHPGAAVRALGSRRYAGQPLDRVWPGLAPSDLVLDNDVTAPRGWVERGVAVVFSALPHGALAGRAKEFLAAGLKVIDLSADFRLRDPAEYPRRYQFQHPAPDLLADVPYGLVEWCCGELPRARLVANPGCYATAVLLSVLPAVAAGWWSGAPIVVNALSGISGAGRAPRLGTQFVEVDNSAAPYKVGEDHAHLGEIKQGLKRLGGVKATDPAVIFNPHLVPMARGILATVALPLLAPVTDKEAQTYYQRRYAAAPFVRVLAAGTLPETRHVRGSNRCDLAVRVAAAGRMLLIYAALDNLVKGAAGQAVQNWNRMLGWPEETGLPVGAWACV